VPSIVADFRASAGIDVEHDTADRAAGRTLTMPVTVLQQDWGAALGFDAAARWRAWAPDLVHESVPTAISWPMRPHRKWSRPCGTSWPDNVRRGPFTSRRPACAYPAVRLQCWFEPPLSAHCSISAPVVVAPLTTSATQPEPRLTRT
jgi:hypothetical protein